MLWGHRLHKPLKVTVNGTIPVKGKAVKSTEGTAANGNLVNLKGVVFLHESVA